MQALGRRDWGLGIPSKGNCIGSVTQASGTEEKMIFCTVCKYIYI